MIYLERKFDGFRYLELTEEDKEKLKGSYKVAKKLEKLEGKDSRGFDSGKVIPTGIFEIK